MKIVYKTKIFCWSVVLEIIPDICPSHSIPSAMTLPTGIYYIGHQLKELHLHHLKSTYSQLSI